MYLKNIKIKNFRNYKNLDISFKKGINIIYGENGQGKTNLLESIYFLAMTKSHRSYIDNNLINNEESLFKLNGDLYINNIKNKLEIIYDGTEKKLKQDNKKINKVSDYISKMNIIVFYPDDLSLIKGSPSDRRRFLNSEISQLNSDYLTVINDYNKLLKMRNDYLKNSCFDKNYFNIITNYLIDKAVIIYRMRNKFIDKLNEQIGQIYFNLSNINDFHLKYKNNLNIENYDIENIKNKLKNIYQNNLKKELILKKTLFGPHKDDLEFYINNKNLKNFGSQGQQRMAILSLKLSELNLIKKYKNLCPILLLDDVFSELDKRKKNNLLKYIYDNSQTIITTTDLNNINKEIKENSKLIMIKNGNVEKIRGE